MVVPSLKNKQNGSALMIVVVVLVLAVIAGAGAYVATGGFKNDNNSGTNSQTGNNDNFKVTKATSTADIERMLTAAKAGDYDVQCTLNYDKSIESTKALLSVTGQGTLYMSGSAKMRVDVTINKKPSHFMMLGKTTYLWSDGSTKGSKIPVSSSSSTKSSAEKFSDSATQYDTKCQSVAKLDDSIFILPTGVTFTDINSQFHSQSSSYESGN